MDSLWEEAKKAQHHSSIHPFIFLLPISKTNPIARNISSSSPTHIHLSSTSFTSCSFIILPIITLDHLTSTCRTTSSIFYPSLTHSITAATTEQNREEVREEMIREERDLSVAAAPPPWPQLRPPSSKPPHQNLAVSSRCVVGVRRSHCRRFPSPKDHSIAAFEEATALNTQVPPSPSRALPLATASQFVLLRTPSQARPLSCRAPPGSPP